jgi:hypothetical protein
MAQQQQQQPPEDPRLAALRSLFQPQPGWQYGDVLPVKSEQWNDATGHHTIMLPAMPRAIANAGNSLVNVMAGLAGHPVDPTDVMQGVLPLLAPGSSAGEAAGGSLGIFGSKMAQQLPSGVKSFPELVEALVNHEASGAPLSNEAIHAKTGWFDPGDENARFEIPDQTSRLKLDALKGSSLGTGHYFVPSSGAKLGDILDHPALFKAYPHLADLDVMPTPMDQLNSISGSFNPGTGVISLTGGSKEGLRQTLLHELQHAVDSHEGYQAGGSPSQFLPKPVQQLQAELEPQSWTWDTKLQNAGWGGINEVTRQYTKLGTLPRELAHEPYADDLHQFIQKQLAVNAAVDAAHQQYRNLGGETLARAVEDRMYAGRAPEPTPWQSIFAQTPQGQINWAGAK